MVNRQEWYTTNDDSNGASLGTPTNWAAQSFTIGTTGDNLNFDLSTVMIYLHSGGFGTMELGIYNVLPDGSPDLVTGTISTGSFSTTNTGIPVWWTATMTPVTLQKDRQYILTANEGAGGSGTKNWREDASSPTYTGGSVWNSTDSGVTWAITAGSDKLFQINSESYAGILCTMTDVLNKSGTNASSIATNESIVSNYVKQAEGVVNTVCRYNWNDDYLDLDDDIKYILNQVVSDLAAIYIIQYDMSGYTSRIEAEDMINILRDSSLRSLSLLRDKKQQKFITAPTGGVV